MKLAIAGPNSFPFCAVEWDCQWCLLGQGAPWRIYIAYVC